MSLQKKTEMSQKWRDHLTGDIYIGFVTKKTPVTDVGIHGLSIQLDSITRNNEPKAPYNMYRRLPVLQRCKVVGLTEKFMHLRCDLGPWSERRAFLDSKRFGGLDESNEAKNF